MARSPDARVVKAKELFDQGLKLIEIANTLRVSEGTVRSWKSRYKWNNATLQKPKRNVAKSRGGQRGNQNAAGNRGGAAPQGNKNALKTGEFETLFFDTLKEDEKRLIGLEKGKDTDREKYEGKLGQIQAPNQTKTEKKSRRIRLKRQGRECGIWDSG